MTVGPVSAAVSVPARDHAWLVGLRSTDGNTFCSGVLIAPRRVITAAHCIAGFSRHAPRLSVTTHEGSKTAAVVETVPHPRYDIVVDDGPRHTNVVADIAVLHLAESIRLSQYPNLTTGNVRGETYLYGMSSNRSDSALRLRKVTKLASKWFNHVDPRKHIVAVSATGTASCSGDSGGGLITWVNGKPVLTGVVSYGAVRCGDPVPTVFSKVSAYMSWLYVARR
jgi:secreted trypsin-like serine protease